MFHSGLTWWISEDQRAIARDFTGASKLMQIVAETFSGSKLMPHHQIVHYLAWISIILGLMSAFIIGADILSGRHQQMGIMNVVWPVTGLYGGPAALYFYYTIGRRQKSLVPPEHEMHRMKGMHDMKNLHHMAGMQMKQKQIDWKNIFTSTLHCGAGCTLGDIAAEIVGSFFIFILFGHSIFGQWALSFVFAFAFGILFQYYSIRPMTSLSPIAALKEAVKADSLSLTCWQIGMYGWMAIAVFVLFRHNLYATDPLFWFMMQLAMGLGFLTAYPVNGWLLRKGIKQPM